MRSQSLIVEGTMTAIVPATLFVLIWAAYLINISAREGGKLPASLLIVTLNQR